MSIKVLIVDDSATARAVLQEILESTTGIEVIGTAPDAYVARDKIVALKPDVVCLDVEMPRMDGITFLKKLMIYMPVPVIMVSSLTRKGAQVTLEALEAGAIDFVTKPNSNIFGDSDAIKNELISKVRAASRAKLHKKPNISAPAVTSSSKALAETTRKVIAIGASTGGTAAIKSVLQRLPRNIPGIVIVQHMPPEFTRAFAERLDSECEIEVAEAKNKDPIVPGRALIANGAYHMVIRRSGSRYYVEIGDGEKVSGHKPSVDVLFNSVAQYAGANALGILLTGMGSDGAQGMLNLHRQGAPTIAQDERSCVVFGMPKVAIELGGADKVLPLMNIPQEVVKIIDSMRSE